MFCVSINSVQNQQFIFHNVLHGCTQNKLPVWQWKCDYLMKLCCPCTFDLLLNGILPGVMCIWVSKQLWTLMLQCSHWYKSWSSTSFDQKCQNGFHNLTTEMSQLVVLLDDNSSSGQKELHSFDDVERFSHWTDVSNFLISQTSDIPLCVNFKPQIVVILSKRAVNTATLCALTVLDTISI